MGAKANQPQQASEVIRARPARSEEDSQPDQPLPDQPLGALRTRRAQAKVKSASTKSDRRENLVFDSFTCKALANPSSKTNPPKQTPEGSQILRQEGDVPSAISHDRALFSSARRSEHVKWAACRLPALVAGLLACEAICALLHVTSDPL